MVAGRHPSRRARSSRSALARLAAALGVVAVIASCGASAEPPVVAGVAVRPVPAVAGVPPELVAPVPIAASTAGPPTTVAPTTVAPTTVVPANTTPTTAASVAPTTAPPAVAAAARVSPTPAVDAHTLAWAGRDRHWLAVVPAAATTGRRLLVVLHGRDASGAAMRAVGLEVAAARAGAVVAYPDAVDGSWNDGRVGVDSTAHREGVDDVGFLRAVVADAVARYGVDPARVAVVGFSNGAMMADRLACDAAEVFPVVVQVAGAAAADQLDRCHPARPEAIHLIVSRADPVVPFAGGPIASNGKSRGAAAAARTVAAWWAKADACTGSTSATLPATNPPVARASATGCTAGGAVVIDELDVAQHAFFEQPGYSAVGATWAFLADHGIG